MTMADRIAVMNAGRVEQLGSPVELYERPATAFVANFLGQSNLLDAVVVGRGSEAGTVDVAGRMLTVPALRGRPLGERVRVGVRPEKIRIVAAGTPGEPGACQLDGTITAVAFSGVSTQYVVTTPWGQELAVFAQNIAGDPSLAPGALVSLRWASEHTFVVSGEDGQAGGAGGDAAGVEGADPEAAPTPGSIAGTVAGGRR